ncbi:MFS transporter [Allostreptomyces psammosilenae]|uniref:MFS family permease n=1 Tax=Allostreptomyces psammosilenae TaxID=1892865 RepID=A0A852ZNU2_9ACTN|nr:MFS transporter [Allostreptomyces psammosilenae]NYI04063.1 MFS family permease [Allostreptomyces psammosilenae]
MAAPALPEAPPRAGLTLFALCLAVLIVPLGLSGAPVALPAIGRDLDAGVVPLQWVVNAYNVTAASFMMAAGSIADRVGRRRVFAFGVALYGGCSLLAAAATHIVVLDVARAFAGLAAAAIMTAGVSVIANTFSGAARTRAFAFVGVTIGAGLAIGPTTTGLIVSGLGWRYVFLLQAAITLAALLGFRLVRESRDPDAGPVDWPGTLTFTLALFLFTLAVIEGPQWGWSSAGVLGLLAGCAALLTAFVLVERRRPAPMFDLSLFAEPRFVAVNLLATAVSFGFVGLLVLLPSYLVGAGGLTDGRAGLTMLLLTAPVLVFPLVAERLLQAGVTLRAIISGSLLLVAAGCGWLTVVHPGTGPLALAGPLLLVGGGIGLIYGLMDGAAVSTVPPAKAGMASGMFNTIRLASEAVAVAGMVAALVSLVRDRVADGLDAYRPAADGAGTGTAGGDAGGLEAGAVADSVASGNLDGPAALVPAEARQRFVEFLGEGYSAALAGVLWGACAICAVSAVVLYGILAERRDDGPSPADDDAGKRPAGADPVGSAS